MMTSTVDQLSRLAGVFRARLEHKLMANCIDVAVTSAESGSGYERCWDIVLWPNVDSARPKARYRIYSLIGSDRLVLLEKVSGVYAPAKSKTRLLSMINDAYNELGKKLELIPTRASWRI